LRYCQLPAVFVMTLTLSEQVIAQSTPVPPADAPGSPMSQVANPLSSPTLQVEKIGPTSLNVGKPLRYEIVIRNTGSTPS